MKIKNTPEIRLRADAHAKADHVKQGTYGRGKVNGLAGYRGCAVGCLSTPHRRRDLLKFLREQATKVVDFKKGKWFDFEGYGNQQRRLLAEEFGICNELAVIAEGCFESQVTNAEAIDFVRDFAHALPEGVDVRDRNCAAFLRSQGLRRVRSYNNIIDAVAPFQVTNKRASKAERQRVEDFTTAFLAWLRNGCRVPAKIAAAA